MCAVDSAVIADGCKSAAARNCPAPRACRARDPLKNPLNRKTQKIAPPEGEGLGGTVDNCAYVAYS